MLKMSQNIKKIVSANSLQHPRIHSIHTLVKYDIHHHIKHLKK